MELKIELQDGWKPNECDFCIDPYGAKLNEPCPKDCPLVVAWEKKQDEEKSKPAPVEEKATADGSLMEELESLASEDNSYYMSINGQKHGGQSYVSRKSLQEIISRYRPSPPAVEELVRELKLLVSASRKIQPRSYESVVVGIEEIIRKYDNAKGDK